MNSIPRFVLRNIVLFTLLFGFAAVSLAQEDADQAAQRRKQARQQQRKMLHSKTMQEMQKRIAKTITKSLWSGKGGNQMLLGLTQNAETRKSLGITDEQFAALNKGMMGDQNDPKLQEFMKKMGEFQNLEDVDDAPEEKRREVINLQSDMMEYLFEKQAAIIEKELTTEQKRKLQEIQIATMDTFPIVAPNMFEALNLSDDQRGQLDKIKKDLEPDFEKNMNGLFDAQIKMMNKISEYQDREDIDLDWSKPEEAAKKMEEIQKKVMAENPDLQKELNQMLDDGAAFTKHLKFQMFDVLTDEQMARMSELINNPPDYVTKIRDKMRERVQKARGSSTGGININAWQPGDPIPEEYIQKRKARFPRR